ncbi:hypothetical protein Droror1_Dr00012831 [Drosera rotundifolia]
MRLSRSWVLEILGLLSLGGRNRVGSCMLSSTSGQSGNFGILFTLDELKIAMRWHSCLRMKCENMIILKATNLSELDKEWNSLLELSASDGVLTLAEPFVSKSLTKTLSDVEAAQPLSSLGMAFPDLYIGGGADEQVRDQRS